MWLEDLWKRAKELVNGAMGGGNGGWLGRGRATTEAEMEAGWWPTGQKRKMERLVGEKSGKEEKWGKLGEHGRSC